MGDSGRIQGRSKRELMYFPQLFIGILIIASLAVISLATLTLVALLVSDSIGKRIW